MMRSIADGAGSVRSLCIQMTMVLGAMCMALVGTQVQAQDQIHTPTEVRVSYADLDLSRSVDVATLYQRLKLAAKRACDVHTNDLRNLRVQHLQQRCYESALRMAVDQVAHSSIKALYAGNAAGAVQRR